jgi:hypothetical protein
VQLLTDSIAGRYRLRVVVLGRCLLRVVGLGRMARLLGMFPVAGAAGL